MRPVGRVAELGSLDGITHMTIAETFLVLLGITIVVVSLCVIPQFFSDRRRKRTIAGLASTQCPACGIVFGSSVATTVSARIHMWTPAPGYSVSQLDLPSETLRVICPHCAAECDYRLDGRFFERPA